MSNISCLHVQVLFKAGDMFLYGEYIDNIYMHISHAWQYKVSIQLSSSLINWRLETYYFDEALHDRLITKVTILMVKFNIKISHKNIRDMH